MIEQQKLVSLLLIAASVIGCINSQRITLPLKLDDQDYLFLTVKYGSQQCEKNVGLSLDYCSNVITEIIEKTDHCGSEFVVDNTVTEAKDYIAPFQFGDTQANLYFSIPTDPNNRYYGQNILCFGYQSYLEQRNTLIELFQQGKLTLERVYFSFNNSSSLNSENGIVGQIDIGEPNLSLIKKGSHFVELNRFDKNTFAIYTDGDNIKYFGQNLDSLSIVTIDINSPFTKLTIYAFQAILKLYDHHNIKYNYYQDQDYTVILPSIEQLQDIHVTLQSKDNTPFFVTLKPSQYTRLLPDGQYQLMIYPLIYSGYISLSHTLFESYYVGFDLPHQVILIAEKKHQQHQQESTHNNFRGFQNI